MCHARKRWFGLRYNALNFSEQKKTFNRRESERLYELSKSNPREFWREFKGGSQRREIPDLNFFEHFKNLAEREDTLSNEGRIEVEIRGNVEGGDLNELLDSPFTYEELEENIRALKGKTNKAAGCDYILNEFITNASLTMKLLILSMFNQILTLGYFPEELAKGEIAAVWTIT